MISSLTKTVMASVMALAIAACGEPSPPPPTDNQPQGIPFSEEGSLTFKRSDGSEITTIRIEIADDDSTRTRGLMQRTSMPGDGGMLFVFPNQEIRSFWMANTPLSLDMIFVERDGEIIDIAKYTKPVTPENVTSRAPATYVVEVKAGFTDTWGISETDVIEWSEHE